MTDWLRRRYENAKLAYTALMKFYPFTLENLDGEQWKPVPNYEDYNVSSFGRVKSFKNGKVKIMKPKLYMNGYLYIGVTKNNKQKAVLIHLLVARLFLQNNENKREVDHVDGVKFNNYVGNLRWSTSKENKAFAYQLGLMKVGENHHNSKLTNEQVIFIRENPEKLTREQLAKKFNVDMATISNVQMGKVYKNSGGAIRTTKVPRVSDSMQQKICADYKRGIRGFGISSLAKKYGIGKTTILSIVQEAEK